ncbi:porin [Vibrio hippocampi]|uniref:Porin-like protein L n=1 Tax=Vibrio hippocampi TaxID=654686 RepID=A0ABM8ZL37_9VIBR|nr:porin [Vibrio hippocampi]CAH0528996.1 Porin-like protein L [Vibrio hippocampi]
MNKKFIALAVAAAAFGTSVQAVELYNNDGSTLSLGGHVSVGVGGSEESDTEVQATSPRINIEATQDLGNGFTADAKAEWALNYLDGGEETFSTRLGYIGLTHAEFGRAVAGTQWAPYYNAAGVADMPIAFANDFIYDNHGALGTGRADKMLSYSNAVSFGNNGDLNVAVGWQGSKTDTLGDTDNVKVDDRYQVALGYAVAGFGINYAYVGGDITVSGNTETAQSNVFSASYGSYGNGLYIAGVYAMNDYMNNGKNGNEDLLEETRAYEALVAYSLANSLNLSVNYEKVEDSKDDLTVTETTAIQAEYDLSPKLRTYAGYQFDLRGEGTYKGNRDNAWLAGVRYFL